MRYTLPFNCKYYHDVIELEKEMNVNYLTNAGYFGHQQGMQQGMQAGIYQANRENAKKMLMMGLAETMIKEVTGLSTEEIESLR